MGASTSNVGQLNFVVSEGAVIGRRETMEDVHISTVLKRHPDIKFWGIYDGHGGTAAANFSAAHLHQQFDACLGIQTPQALELVGERAISSAFILTDEQLLLANPMDKSGSTAVIVAIDTTDHVLLSANIGDAQALICRNGIAESLSTIHKPLHASEKKRIELAGHSVLMSRLDGALAVSRSFGDRYFKHARSNADIEGDRGKRLQPDRVQLHPSLPPAARACSAIPDTRLLHLTPEDEFIVLACDGLFDVMTDQEVATSITNALIRANQDHGPGNEYNRALSRMALELATFAVDVKKSKDNVSVIIVFLDWSKVAPRDSESKTNTHTTTDSTQETKTADTTISPKTESTVQESMTSNSQIMVHENKTSETNKTRDSNENQTSERKTTSDSDNVQRNKTADIDKTSDLEVQEVKTLSSTNMTTLSSTTEE
jgi:serine/threonine protein phosphatase PrpC